MGSEEEIGPFLTHYFRSQYLTIAIIRPFGMCLLLISGDIEKNPGPVSFDRYLKTSTTLSPSPGHHRPITPWMRQLIISTQRNRREAECHQIGHLQVQTAIEQLYKTTIPTSIRKTA